MNRTPKLLKPSSVLRPRRAAFTLLELLVVVAIIGILIGLLLPAAETLRDNAKRKQARVQAISLVKAVKEYRQTYGRYPGQTQGAADQVVDAVDLLAALTNNPRNIVFLELDAANVNADGALTDPWGREFVISMDENANGITVLDATTSEDGGSSIETNIARESVCVFSWGKKPAQESKWVYSWTD